VVAKCNHINMSGGGLIVASILVVIWSHPGRTHSAQSRQELRNLDNSPCCWWWDGASQLEEANQWDLIIYWRHYWFSAIEQGTNM
jgi:hypothetical protein